MVEITEEEYKLFTKLKTALKHSSPEKFPDTYFITGASGNKDNHGMPDTVFLCPAYGLDYVVAYKKVDNV
jgi:hypothetical protein